MDRIDSQFYEVIHPITKQPVTWSGERANAYEVNNRIKLEDYVPKVAKTSKKKTSKPKITDNG